MFPLLTRKPEEHTHCSHMLALFVIVQTSPIVDAWTKQKSLFCAHKGVLIPREKTWSVTLFADSHPSMPP